MDVFFPPRCVICGAGDNWVCDNCWSQVPLVVTPICYRCGKISPEFKICQSCSRSSSLKRMVLCSYWQEPLNTLVYKFKYKKIRVLDEKLSELLINTLNKMELPNCDEIIIMPVPLHRNRLGERGFNQAKLLAKNVARNYSWCLRDDLVRIKATIPQFKLTRYARKDNMKNAFIVKSSIAELENKIVIIVDDVATTGATMEECAMVLKQAGAKEIWGLILARA